MRFQNSGLADFSGTAVAVPPPLPEELTARTPAVEFYKIDSRRIRLREWLRSTSTLTALIGWALKWVGANITATQRAPCVRDWNALEISGDELPQDVREQFSERLAELWEAGFRDPIFYRLVNRFNGYEDFAALFPAPSGGGFARIFFSRALAGHHVAARFETNFITKLEDGRYIWTCDRPQRFDFPPNVLVQYRRHTPLAELWRWHNETVHRAGAGAAIIPVHNAEQLWAVHSDFEACHFFYHERRGLFIAPASDEAAVDGEVATAERQAVDGGSRFADAWAELQRLQTSRGCALNGLLLLVLSVAASIGSGLMQASLGMIAMIVGVLFVHELGHYLAMRTFKYREVRMFFFPLVGAAVTGRHYNVAGWKKAVVSLLGPLPGIFAGAALGAVAIATHHDPLAKISLIAMGLNAFNLLPLLPLDGGWFWNAVFFSRQRGLEIAFKSFAGLSGIAASSIGLGRLWLFLGIVTLCTIPATWLHARIAAKLRARGYQPTASRDDAVPLDTAEAIFVELDTAAKGKLHAKALATGTLQIFERLNTTPPGALVSIALSAAYFVALVVAIVGLSFVAVVHFHPEALAADAESAPKIKPPALRASPPGIADP